MDHRIRYLKKSVMITLFCIHGITSVRGSFESSAAEGIGASAGAAGAGLLKSVWELFGNSMGSVSNDLGSAQSTNQFGSTRENSNYPDYSNRRSQDYSRGNGNYADYSNRGPQDYTRTRTTQNPVNPLPRPREVPRQSSERSGRNRFPDPTRIFDNVERETAVFLRVAPVLSQSTRNTPYEIVEAIFHGPWSWEFAAQHVYALHWDLEYRFDPYGDTVFTFGSRKESDGKLWGSLDKRAFTEMPAKYFFLGNITTSPKAATQAAYDNPLNGLPYDVMTVNCQAWAVEHCKEISNELYNQMKNFPTLLESTKLPGETQPSYGSRTLA